MAMHGICKCGKDKVTNATEGLDWHLNGCTECGETVTFEFEKGARPVRPGRDK